MSNIIDNKTLLDAHDKFEEAQAENKHTSLVFEIVRAAIVDEHDNPSPSELESLKSYYETDPESFEEEALPIYMTTTQLYENLTERQCNILYKYVVEKFRVKDIANYYSISAPGVIKTIQLIQKKALKLKLNQMI